MEIGQPDGAFCFEFPASLPLTGAALSPTLPAVLLSLALLPTILFAEIALPAGPHPRADAIRTLAEAHAVVLVATKRCDDLSASEDINRLPAALGLSDADTADAYSLLVRLAAEMNATANTVGLEAWCDTTYGRFGPDGTMMKGLLKRCDRKASSC